MSTKNKDGVWDAISKVIMILFASYLVLASANCVLREVNTTVQIVSGEV